MNFSDTSNEKLSRYFVLQLELAGRNTLTIVAETLIAVIMGLMGIVGNSLVCTAVYRSTRLQTKTNYYVTGLAVLDLVQTVLMLFLALPVLITGRWIFNDTVCQMEGGVTVVLGTGSIYTLMLIAINRYFVMVWRNFHRTYFTTRKIIASIAVFSLLSSNFMLSYTLQGYRYSFHPGKALCIFNINNIPASYGLPVALTNVTIPFLIICVCYIRIYLEVRKHKATHLKSSKSDRREKSISSHDIKITKTLFVTVCAFAVCWTPFVVIDMIDLWIGPYTQPRQLYVFYSVMTGCSSVVNPAIYGVMNPDFRKEFRNILSCRKRSARVGVATLP